MTNYVVACSKRWFKLTLTEVENQNNVIFIRNKSKFNLERLKRINPRFIFLPHWNWVVSEDIFRQFECVVFHTGPLPFGRGGSPIQNLIVRGFKRSPVCALRMNGVIDGGPIYSKVDISLTNSLAEIFERVNEAVNILINEIISSEPQPKEQEGNVVIFKRRSEKDNQIPHGLSLSDVYDRIRMLDDEEYSKAYFKCGDYLLELESAELNESTVSAQVTIKKCE